MYNFSFNESVNNDVVLFESVNGNNRIQTILKKASEGHRIALRISNSASQLEWMSQEILKPNT